MCKEKIWVLIVEDDEDFRSRLKKSLQAEFGFHVDLASNAAEAEKLLEENRSYDVAVIDENLSELPNGITWLASIKPNYPDMEFIVFTAWGESSRPKALQAGAFRFIAKPFNWTELAMVIRSAAQAVRLRVIHRKILKEQTLKPAMAEVMIAIRALTLASQVEIILRDGGESNIEHFISPQDVKRGWKNPMKSIDLTAVIMRSSQPISIPDLRQDPRVPVRLAESKIRSLVALPIPGKADNILGALYAFGEKAEHFNEYGAVAMLKTFAGMTGLAVQNVRKFEYGERIRNQLDILDQIVLEIEQEQDVDVLLQKVLGHACKLVGAKGGRIYFLNPSADKLQQKTAVGFTAQIDPIGIDDATGVSKVIIMTGRPFKVDDYSNWEGRRRKYDEYKFTRVAGAPIRARSRILGTLVVHDTQLGKVFTQNDLDLLQKFADHVGLILRRIQGMNWLTTIQNVSNAIAAPITLREILNRTCEEAAMLFEVEHCGLLLFDANGEWGILRGEWPVKFLNGSLREKDKSFRLKGIAAEERLLNKEHSYIPDVEAEREELKEVYDLFRLINIRSILMVPIIYEDRVIGSLSLDSIGHKREFTEDDINLCRQLASSVGVAIENALNIARYDFLKKINEALALAADLPKSLEEITKIMVSELRTYDKASFSVVLLKDESERNLVVRAASPITRQIGFQWDPGIDKTKVAIYPADGPQAQVLSSILEKENYIILVQDQKYDVEYLQEIARTLKIESSADEACEKPRYPVVSALLIPLRTPRETFGLLVLGEVRNRLEATFTKEQAEQAKTACDQAALLIERIRTNEKLTKQLQDMGRLRAIGLDIQRVDESLKETLQKIVDAARIQTGADCASIYPYQPGKDEYDYENITFSGFNTPESEINVKAPEHARIDKMVLENGFLIVDDISLGTDRSGRSIAFSPNSLPQKEGVKAFIAMSLVSKDKEMKDVALCVLFLNYRNPHFFSDYEWELVGLLAGQAAVAIQQNRLFVQVSDQGIRLRNAMLEVSQMMNRLRGDLRDTFQSVADSLREVLKCSIVTAYHYDDQSQTITDKAVTSGNLYEPDELLIPDEFLSSPVVLFLMDRKEAYYSENSPDDQVMNTGGFVKREKVVSSVGIPIWIKEHLSGFMFANYRVKHTFSKEEKDAVKIFTSLTAVAINNAHQYQREQVQTKIIRAIQDTLADIIKPEASPSIVQFVEDTFLSVGKILKWEAASLMRLNKSGTHYIVHARYGLGPDYNQSIPKDKIGMLASKYFDKWGHYYNDDLRKNPLGDIEPILREDLCSAVSVILDHENSKTQIEGILTVYSKGRPMNWSEAEVEILRTLSEEIHVAIHTIENVRLINKRKQALEALYRAGELVSEDLSLNEILTGIIKNALDLTGLSGEPAFMGDLVKWEDEKLVLFASYPEEQIINMDTGKPYLDPKNDERKGIIGRAFEKREPQQVDDVWLDPDYITLKEETRSELAVPILIGNRCYGVINVEHKEVGGLTNEDRTALEILADLAAVAIENANNREQMEIIQKKVGGRLKLAAFGIASSTWMHSIRNKTVAVSDWIYLIEKDPNFQQLLKKSPEIQSYLYEMKQVISEILKKKIIVPILSTDGVKPVAVNELLQEWVTQYIKSKSYPEAHFDLIGEKQEKLFVSVLPEWLKYAVDLLVNNSYRALNGQLIKTITLGACRVGKYVELSVSDTGCGISKEIKDKIFNEHLQNTSGLGSGLLTVRAIAETFGGNARIKETSPEGTTVILQLPLVDGDDS